MYGPHWKPREVRGDIANFRRNGMTAGLDGHTRVGGESAKAGVDGSAIACYTQLASVAPRAFIKEVLCIGPGNPYTVQHDGLELTTSDVQAAFNAWRLSRYCNPRRVVEIGPGFGCLAAMMRKMWPNSEITLIDLPEHHEFQKYYLEQTVGLDGFSVQTNLPEDADLVVAIRCMMEFSEKEVKRYLDWLQALPSLEYFYIVNRYMKQNVFKEYPFDSRWIPLISQTMWPTAEIHELLLMRTEIEGDVLKGQLRALPPFMAGGLIMDYSLAPDIKAWKIKKAS